MKRRVVSRTDYDTTGLVTNKVYADGKGPRYDYTPDGKLAMRIWARGIVTDYSYDNWGNLTNTVYLDGTPTITLFYDTLGRQTEARDAAGVTTFLYDSFGSLTNETVVGVAGTNTIIRYWDDFGRTTGYTLNNARQTTICYEPDKGRISTMETFPVHSPTPTQNSNYFTWNYLDGSDLKSSLAYPNDLTASWTYDANNQLLQVCNATLTNVISQYDYTYDFDDIGNRETSSERGTNSFYYANNLNQYTAVDDFTPQFDDDMRPRQRRRVARRSEATEPRSGRKRPRNQTLIKTATGIWQVTYNGENRPILWQCVSTNSLTPNSSTPLLISMSYDCMGRRVTKNNQRFVYDGYLQIANTELETLNSKLKTFIWDPTEPVAARPLVFYNSNAPPRYYTHDGNKNVSEIVAENGDVATHYEYAPFGAVIAQCGVSVAANPWRFSSEFAEDDTATVYYNYRHYEPVMGRWMSRDRIEERGGVKLYAAFENDSVCQFDSEGDVVIEAILAVFLLELANHYVCDWYAHDGLDNETDAYKHCMVSCRYSKCTSILNGKLIAAINTFLGGVVYEIVSSNNSWEGAIDDIKSNLIGIVHSFIPFESCEKACECERGRWNR